MPVGNAIPIALHENGQIPDPAAMFSTSTRAPWVLFNTWATYEMPATSPGNTVAYVQSVYANPNVVTRDEVPSLK